MLLYYFTQNKPKYNTLRRKNNLLQHKLNFIKEISGYSFTEKEPIQSKLYNIIIHSNYVGNDFRYSYDKYV